MVFADKIAPKSTAAKAKPSEKDPASMVIDATNREYDNICLNVYDIGDRKLKPIFAESLKGNSEENRKFKDFINSTIIKIGDTKIKDFTGEARGKWIEQIKGEIQNHVTPDFYRPYDLEHISATVLDAIIDVSKSQNREVIQRR